MSDASSGNWIFRRYVSLDTLLLVILVLPNLQFNQLIEAIVVSAILLYAVVDIVLGQYAGAVDETKERRKRLGYRLKLILLTFIIALVVVLPTIALVITRPRGEPDQHLQDGAFQTEVAIRYLISGKNPYVETYVGSGLERYFLSDTPENPALYNFVYLPFLLLLSLPFYLASYAILGWYDQRLVYLATFMLSLALLSQLAREPAKKLMLLALFSLNFFTVQFLREGFNDILIFTFLLMVILAIRRGRLSIGFFIFGLACATKPSVWFLAPFFSVFIARSLSWRENLIFWTKRVFPFWLAIALTVGPFLVWDVTAFVRSTVMYTLGLGSSTVYPIRGYGFSEFLLSLGAIPSPLAQYPFWVLQIAASIPVLVVALRQLVVENSMSRLLFGYAAVFIVVVFFSRFFQGNYFHFALLVIFVAMFMDPFQFGGSVPQERTVAIPDA